MAASRIGVWQRVAITLAATVVLTGAVVAAGKARSSSTSTTTTTSTSTSTSTTTTPPPPTTQPPSEWEGFVAVLRPTVNNGSENNGSEWSDLASKCKDPWNSSKGNQALVKDQKVAVAFGGPTSMDANGCSLLVFCSSKALTMQSGDMKVEVVPGSKGASQAFTLKLTPDSSSGLGAAVQLVASDFTACPVTAAAPTATSQTATTTTTRP